MLRPLYPRKDIGKISTAHWFEPLSLSGRSGEEKNLELRAKEKLITVYKFCDNGLFFVRRNRPDPTTAMRSVTMVTAKNHGFSEQSTSKRV
jgi:hypothetical protein